ncbi:LysE family translocator [Litorilituus lipolyticus]|uniref:LysE family translocator n=1 Tax=Litorilituus lipolyticus TaxID=2491017 RepID=A0A502KYV6_9GAMM|nr:LysE family translocator [Litorilituus lipolyticus]TPH15171.1 LysE family translocator [Litorilituus lipolyticus]
MIDVTLLSLFIPTFFLVSITPGMCMTLAMTLGMSVGIRKTLWMMYGELLGVAIVAIAAVIGVSAIMLKYPQLFNVLKFIGAGYLLYVGVSMWQSKGKLALSAASEKTTQVMNKQLFIQGFVTAIANPKGWAFMISLLPPFINTELDLAPQLSLLIAVILLSEFSCMMIYATGGKTIAKLLTQANNVKILNKISGLLMMLVALWLALS